ncbi:MAG: FAD-dependent oxidoreductase [Streptosporangiales bacterium]|nr:FAD-dependent oxidoreductase [Streptosporangiales bacterium]
MISTAPVEASLRHAVPKPYWLDAVDAPDPLPALTGATTADLVVVGGGFTGLWTALRAKERDPSLDVVLLEGHTIGWAASGRNGGFCSASLTHGLANGMAHFPGEIERLEELGRENLDAIERTVADHGIDCGFERTGELSVATRPWQVADLEEGAEVARRFGHDVVVLGRDEVRAEVDSPTYLGGVWSRDDTALVDPARLAWGLRDACLRLGVRIHEYTKALSVDRVAGRLRVTVARGRILASHVVLGTGAFSPLLRRLRHFVLPVYDYALVTEPLDERQLASVGWRGRQGLADSGNQFHYYRLTADDRILWGGYDAVYHFGNAVRPQLDQRPETFTRLAGHFFQTFPQLRDVRFTHTWGGVIDTCSRFCALYGTAHGGRLAYAAGYTGLGVGATRFAAGVMLDLLSGEDTELTRLRMVRGKPVPFPPEPMRFGVVQLTRWSLARADEKDGRRNPWLRVLDKLGVGFDS